MIRRILQNIADFLLANQTEFTKVFPFVEMLQDDEGKKFPGYFNEGDGESQPLPDDGLRNYIYLRIDGDISSEDGKNITADTKLQIDTYPIKLVAHYEDNSNNTHPKANAISQLLKNFNYQIPPSDIVTNVNIVPTGVAFDKSSILESESVGHWSSRQDDYFVSISFDLVINFVNGGCVVDALCGISDDIVQIDPCADVAAPQDVDVTETNGTVVSVPCGDTFQCSQNNFTRVLGAGCAFMTWDVPTLVNMAILNEDQYGNENVLEASVSPINWAGANGNTQVNTNGYVTITRGDVSNNWYLGFSLSKIIFLASNIHNQVPFAVHLRIQANRLVFTENGINVGSILTFFNSGLEDLRKMQLRYDGTNVFFDVDFVPVFTFPTSPGAGLSFFLQAFGSTQGAKMRTLEVCPNG